MSSSSIEEGIRLLPSEEEELLQTSSSASFISKKSIYGLLAIFAVGIIGTLGFAAVSSSSVAPLKTHFAAVTDLSKKPSSKSAKVVNEAYKAAIVTPSYEAFHSLRDKVFTQKLNDKYTLEISLFDEVKKVAYDEDGKVKQTFLVGKFAGLDVEANAMFVNGGYCKDRDGPFHAMVAFTCGNELAVQKVLLKDPCSYHIRVSTPTQCENTVKTVGTYHEQQAAIARVDAVYGKKFDGQPAAGDQILIAHKH